MVLIVELRIKDARENAGDAIKHEHPGHHRVRHPGLDLEERLHVAVAAELRRDGERGDRESRDQHGLLQDARNLLRRDVARVRDVRHDSQLERENEESENRDDPEGPPPAKQESHRAA